MTARKKYLEKVLARTGGRANSSWSVGDSSSSIRANPSGRAAANLVRDRSNPYGRRYFDELRTAGAA